MADAELSEIRHQRNGIGQGKAGMELQPGGRAQARMLRRDATRRRHGSHAPFGRAWTKASRRLATAGWSSRVAASPGRRRRQFGCSSMVPGRFGCSASASASSIGRTARAQVALPTWATAAATTGSAASGAGSSPGHAAVEEGLPQGGAVLRPPRFLLGGGVLGREQRRAGRASRCRGRATSRPRSAGRASWSWRQRRAPSHAAGGSRPSLPARTTARASRGCRHRPAVAEAFRHGAKVLADDDRLVAVGFQRQQPQQVVHRVAQIGAVGRSLAPRHQPEPLQPHGMVDAHPAGMAQAGAQRSRKAAKPPARISSGEKAVSPQSWPRG